MFADFLNDRCDIYHLQITSDAPGYGLPGQPKAGYPEEPDLADIPCHFNRSGMLIGLTETNPRMLYPAGTKLQLPIGTDVRMNDRIVDRATGCEFTAGVPYSVGRGHHIAVAVNRMGGQEAV